MAKGKKEKPEINGVLETDIRELMTPEAIKELGALNPTVQQFLLRFTDRREEVLSNDLKKELKGLLKEIYEADNEMMCKNVAEIITAQNQKIFDGFIEMGKAIEGLTFNLSQMDKTNKLEHGAIMTLLEKLSDRQTAAEERLKKEEAEIIMIKQRLDLKKKRMDSFEKAVAQKEAEILKKIKSIDDEIHGEVPITVFKSYRIEKYILAVAIAILLSGIVTYISIQIHSSRMKAIHPPGVIENMK